jgi:hypothetical protein
MPYHDKKNHKKPKKKNESIKIKRGTKVKAPNYNEAVGKQRPLSKSKNMGV